MTWITDGPRTAWLFTSGQESVRLEVVHHTGGVRLLVNGPGKKRASYDFPDMIGLVEHQCSIEQQLVAQGFVLEKFITERRRSPRRR